MTHQTQQKSGCLASLFGIFAGKSSSPDEAEPAIKQFPYRVRDDFLSADEKSFYHVLASVVGPRAVICPKVGLWDIFFVARSNEHRGAKQHIDRKHVDFLLCRLGDMQPILAIELDDSSHQKPARQQRDTEVDAVFAEANLPLLHISDKRGYDTRQLASVLAPYLNGVRSEQATVPQGTTSNTSQANQTGTPLCPKCGTPMVVRVAKQGSNTGGKFYGCPNYPKCQGKLPFEQR